MMPPRYRPLTTGNTNQRAIMAAVRFCADLWDYDPDAFTFIATRVGERWRDHAIQGPERATQVARILASHSADKFDIYFCPYAFSDNHRRREFALPARYGHCDIDLADPDGYDPAPNLLWETSPGRFQGIWKWRDTVEAFEAEGYSRAIVMKDGGDKGGWSITKMLRLPGTVNHKPEYDRPIVTLRRVDDRSQTIPASIAKLGNRRKPWLPISRLGSGDDAATIMRRYRRKMGLPAGALMTARRVLKGDRSRVLFQIVAGLIRAGAPDADIVTVLLDNPYFLAKCGDDLAKAEAEVERIRARIGGA
jgi:hypothetical protein